MRNFPLVLGHGLVNQVKIIQRTLQKGGFGDITVFQAAGTPGNAMWITYEMNYLVISFCFVYGCKNIWHSVYGNNK